MLRGTKLNRAPGDFDALPFEQPPDLARAADATSEDAVPLNTDHVATSECLCQRAIPLDHDVPIRGGTPMKESIPPAVGLDWIVLNAGQGFFPAAIPWMARQPLADVDQDLVDVVHQTHLLANEG